MKSLYETLSEKEINRVAIQKGFVKKKSPINGVAFLRLLLYNSEQGKNLSLNHLCSELSKDGQKVSKQGLDCRFNERSVLFIQALFEKYLQKISSRLPQEDDCGWMKLFSRILVKDGTRFDLPSAFVSHFKGSGGSASQAGICIQFEYDLKTGQIHDISTSSANVPDSKNAQLTKDKILEGDLILRDLGYFGLNIFEEMAEKGACYISKFNVHTTVFELINGEHVPLDFKKLRHDLPLNCYLEKEIYIGEKYKIKTRLVIEKVPDEVYEERIREKKRQAKKKGYNLRHEFMDRQRFNLYITNIEKEKLKPEAIKNIYRLRWQIELVFKQWKSTMKINITHKMKFERWMTLFYARMLLMLIHWQIFHTAKTVKYKKENKLLSLSKCMEALRLEVGKIRDLIGRKKGKFKRTLHELRNKIWNGHEIEKRKGRISLQEIIELTFCITGY